MEAMVFNVLWLTAVAAAAALAGFCMGRLSVQAGDSILEENGGLAVQPGELRGTAAAAGNGGQVHEDGTEKDGGDVWIRMADRLGRQSLAEKSGSSWSGAGQDREGMRQSVRETLEEGGRTGAAGRRGGAEGIPPGVNSRYLRTRQFGRGRKEQQASQVPGRTVGSPVTGLVVSYREGDHPAVLISPLEDKLYAPANGKVVKLFPMGNAFLFRTEFGTELYIQAGDAGDDLLGRYFRPRVVQNEIVNKGKLLLEFDRIGLKAEGVSFAVTVRVENRSYGSSVTMTAKEQVRPGEEILRVQERYFPERDFMEK